MPALVWCGADLIIPDIAAPATRENYHMLAEYVGTVRRPPSSVARAVARRGKSYRDVASLILDRLETWSEV
jgi:hypothetical protein